LEAKDDAFLLLDLGDLLVISYLPKHEYSSEEALQPNSTRMLTSKVIEVTMMINISPWIKQDGQGHFDIFPAAVSQA